MPRMRLSETLAPIGILLLSFAFVAVRPDAYCFHYDGAVHFCNDSCCPHTPGCCLCDSLLQMNLSCDQNYTGPFNASPPAATQTATHATPLTLPTVSATATVAHQGVGGAPSSGGGASVSRGGAYCIMHDSQTEYCNDSCCPHEPGCCVCSTLQSQNLSCSSPYNESSINLPAGPNAAGPGAYCVMFDGATQYCADCCCPHKPGCCWWSTLQRLNLSCNSPYNESFINPPTASTSPSSQIVPSFTTTTLATTSPGSTGSGGGSSGGGAYCIMYDGQTEYCDDSCCPHKPGCCLCASLLSQNRNCNSPYNASAIVVISTIQTISPTSTDYLATDTTTTTTTSTTTTSRPLSECEKRRRASQQLVGRYVPRCLDNGDFDLLQCRGHPGTGDCWCSDLDGREIPGSLMEAPNFPECEEGSNLSPCTYQMIKHIRGQLLGSFRPRCTVDGQFERKQCHVDTCFCVDEGTGQRKPGTEVHIPDTPDCDDDSVDMIETTPVGLKPDRNQGNEQDIDIDDDSQVIYHHNTGEGKGSDSLDLDVNIEGGESEEDLEEEEELPMEETNETGTGSDAEVAKKKHNKVEEASEIMTQPGILAGIIGGSVVLLLCLVLLVMFIVYRMRKKDEGSYPLDEPNRRTPNYNYVRAPEREFYA
ncbi:uncharacterized protein LOC101853551 [Aplysia californica]|uniref:Syndecan n=2 Tax=Aplysia californica TaxID=6500 RepID=A0ABM0ZZ52_APLCA|nr:uncharacterized protein LOC101853551 [Aplysia californica]